MLKVKDIIQAQKILLEKLESMHVSYTLSEKPFTVYMNFGANHLNRIYIWWNDNAERTKVPSTHCIHEDIELENTEIPAELLQ